MGSVHVCRRCQRWHAVARQHPSWTADGALALDEQGRYVQLNGDHRTELNQSQVATACRRARYEHRSGPRVGFRRPGATYQPIASKPPATAPVVTVRKRRVLEIV